MFLEAIKCFLFPSNCINCYAATNTEIICNTCSNEIEVHDPSLICVSACSRVFVLPTIVYYGCGKVLIEYIYKNDLQHHFEQWITFQLIRSDAKFDLIYNNTSVASCQKNISTIYNCKIANDPKEIFQKNILLINYFFNKEIIDGLLKNNPNKIIVICMSAKEYY